MRHFSSVSLVLAVTLASPLSVPASSPPGATGAVWWDGSRSQSTPKGKLLSGNEGYWGEQIDAGIRYSFESTPAHPADNPVQRQTGRGRLFDGIPTGDLKTPVGVHGEALSVIFELGASYLLTEVDISTHSSPSQGKIEVQDADGEEWRSIEVESVTGNDPGFTRLILKEPVEARSLRVQIKSNEGEVHRLSEVWIWGEPSSADASAQEIARDHTPGLPGMVYSFPGMKQTAFPEARLAAWRKKLAADGPVLWNRYEKPDSAWLPGESLENVRLTTLRNGTATATLVITAAGTEPVTGSLSLTPFPGESPDQGPKAQLLVGGIVETQRWGSTPRPFFKAENRLPAPLLNRYLLNAAQVNRFPGIDLAPGQSLVVRVDLKANGAAAGVYQAALELKEAGVSLPIELEVLNAELPTPDVWVNSWSGPTPSMPFHTTERLKAEMSYRNALGITIWNDGPPLPGTISEAVREIAPDLVYLLRLPRPIVDAGWKGEIPKEGLNEADQTAVVAHLQGIKAQMKELNIPDKQWFLELWDEPRARNIEGFYPVAKLVKETDPSIPIYANPCFWIDSERGFSTDGGVYQSLHPWYEELVDISIVQIGLEDTSRFPKTFELFDRDSYAVRGVYQHPSPSRKAVWKTFERGWNGWGFYSYARPRGNPWNDFDAREFDYQYVYPGPHGPITTADSEAFRACWEDYRLLTLMKERKMNSELKRLFRKAAQYKANDDFDALRAEALGMLKKSLASEEPR